MVAGARTRNPRRPHLLRRTSGHRAGPCPSRNSLSRPCEAFQPPAGEALVKIPEHILREAVRALGG
nr:hypothetical protein [Streptomyces sp. ME19-01-6]